MRFSVKKYVDAQNDEGQREHFVLIYEVENRFEMYECQDTGWPIVNNRRYRFLVNYR